MFSSVFDAPSGGMFHCHKVLSIGFSEWKYPLSKEYGGKDGGFGFHEVGWLNNCEDEDPIFDPCLKVADDPVNFPETNPVLPCNMIFNDYKPKLVVPSYLQKVKSKKHPRARRLVQ